MKGKTKMLPEKYDKDSRQQQMLEKLESRRHETVDMTRWIGPIGEFLSGREELKLPDDLVELATIAKLLDYAPNSSALKVLFAAMPDAQNRLDALRSEVFCRLGLEVNDGH